MSACGARTEACSEWLKNNEWECTDYKKVLRYLMRDVGLPAEHFDEDFDGTANHAISVVLWIRAGEIYDHDHSYIG